MNPNVHTLSASSVNLVLHVLGLQGLEVRALCRETGIAPEQLQDVNARVTIAQMVALWQAAVRATGNPDLALHVGEAVNPTSAGIIAYVMMNAPTLHESLRKFASTRTLCAKVYAPASSCSRERRMYCWRW